MRGDVDFFAVFGAIFKDEWRDEALCSEYSNAIFFEEEFEDIAQDICDSCPVRLQCLDNAIAFNDGGFRCYSEKTRKSIVMHRKRHAQAITHDVGLNGG